MAIERLSTLSALSAGFPSILADREFAEFYSDPASPAAAFSVVDETVRPLAGGLPASGKIILDLIPTDPRKIIIATTPAAAASEYTVTTSAGALSAGQVRISYDFPERLDFPTADAGTILYFSYPTRGLTVSASFLSSLYAEVQALQTWLLGAPSPNALEALAGEDIPAETFLYLKAADGKFWKADPTDPTKYAVAFAASAYTTGETVTGYREHALALSTTTPPTQTPLWLGRGGKITYAGANDGTQLLGGNTIQPVGFYAAGRFYLNLKQPVLGEFFT